MRSRTEYVDAVDDQGRSAKLLKIISQIQTSDGFVDGLASVQTADGEQCTLRGNGIFEAIHTKRKFTLV